MPKKRRTSLKEYVGLFDITIPIRAKTEEQAYQRAVYLDGSLRDRRRPRWIGALEITHIGAEEAVIVVPATDPQKWAADWLARMKA